MSNKEHYELNTPNLYEVGQEIQKRVKQGYEISYGPELVGWLYIVRFERSGEAPAEVVVAAATEAPAKPRGPKPKKAVTPAEA